jgi:hypothetical protein
LSSVDHCRQFDVVGNRVSFVSVKASYLIRLFELLKGYFKVTGY